MDDALQLLTALAALVAALTAGVKAMEWTRPSRLRTRLTRDLELMQKLNSNSPERSEMAEHIAREVHLLAETSVAETEEVVRAERALFAHDGFLFPVTYAVTGGLLIWAMTTSPDRPPPGLGIRVGVGLVGTLAVISGALRFGLSVMFRRHRSKKEGSLDRRGEARSTSTTQRS